MKSGALFGPLNCLGFPSQCPTELRTVTMPDHDLPRAECAAEAMRKMARRP